MKLDTFKHLVEQIKENQEVVNSLYSKIDLTNITDGFDKAITILLKSYYGEEGEDWISWFLYERDPETELIATDKEGNEICKTVEELWEICEECRIDKEDYVIPTPLTDEERLQMVESIFNK